MKNLHVFQITKVSLDATIVGQCIDADNGRILVLTREFKVHEVQGDQLGESKIVEHDFDNHAADLQVIEPDDVILVDFIVEDGSILVAHKNGQVIRIGVSSFSPASCVIYKHPKCLSSIKLSPDQDLIALADQDNDICILSSDWMQVYSSNGLTESDSVHKPVGVGWGSKETQFFGLDGRPSKEKQDKNQIVVEEDELQRANIIEQSSLFDKLRKNHDRSTVIDWRGDGQFLATLTYIPDCDKHYLKVWNRNLELQYMSEQLVTIERGLLSWIPNGQYACCAQRRDVRVNEIAMFEKNGMVHQRVSLPTLLPHLYIQELMWSPDSKILAIIVAQFAVDSQSQITRKSMIMLYTMQNFQYYLKYTAHLPSEESYCYSLKWNPIHHNILYVATDRGHCIEYNCVSTVDYCHEGATVVVTDANKLQLTPFDICNIPPPMSAINVNLSSLVNRLIVDTSSIARLMVLTLDGKLYYSSKTCDQVEADINTCLDNKAVAEFKSKLGVCRTIHFPEGYTFQNITLLDERTLLATRQNQANCEIHLLEIANDQIKTKMLKQIERQHIVAIVNNSHSEQSNSICLFLDDSSCMRLDLSSNEIVSRFKLKETSERLYIKDTQYDTRYDVVMTLTMDLTLRINEHIIVSNCTSFKISDNFLVYTTADNLINFLPLDRIVSSEKQSELGSWNQPIENDGILVLVSENDSKVILQMPRGNLEILHPRIMVLLRIISFLDDYEFTSAMKLARRYRVDLNFLCDYLIRCNEKHFYGEGLEDFVNPIGVEDPNLLNILITELSSEDTTQGRYSSAMKYLPARTRELMSKEGLSNDKVNRICRKILGMYELAFKCRFEKHVQPQLLCLLKMQPRRAGAALEIVYALDDKEEKEASLKFLLYFVHADQLFLDAISTYNTDIALMVATVSSRDPKEYLALLGDFKAIDNSHLRRYKMDVHIKNYESAFSHLLAYLGDCVDKESVKSQLIDLMVSKRLYKHAIREHSYQLVNFERLTPGKIGFRLDLESLSSEIWAKYGDYLLEKRYYLEAGIAYSRSIKYGSNRGKKLDDAMKCFMLADDWVRCLAVMERYGIDESKRNEFIKRIAENLIRQGERATAILVRRSITDNELALDLADTPGHHQDIATNWQLAPVFADDQGQEKVYEKIRKSIIEKIVSLQLNIDDEVAKAKQHFERLKELILSPKSNDHFDSENCYTADSLSTIDGSEATSVISGSRRDTRTARSGAPSIATRKSSKSSKSQPARRKINLKAGSRHEDMALVQELQDFIERQKSVQESARIFLAAAVEFEPSSMCVDQEYTNKRIVERYDLAREICNALWPQIEHEKSVFSLYNRFGKMFVSEAIIDNTDVKLLMRPDIPSSTNLFEF